MELSTLSLAMLTCHTLSRLEPVTTEEQIERRNNDPKTWYLQDKFAGNAVEKSLVEYCLKAHNQVTNCASFHGFQGFQEPRGTKTRTGVLFFQDHPSAEDCKSCFQQTSDTVDRRTSHRNLNLSSDTETRHQAPGYIINKPSPPASLVALYRLHAFWDYEKKSGSEAHRSDVTIATLRAFEFSQQKQLQSVVVRHESFSFSRTFVLAKGSPTMIAKACLKDSLPSDFYLKTRDLARRGYYVLAVGSRKLKNHTEDSYENVMKAKRDDLERDLTFSGLLFFKNSLRPKSSEAISHLKQGCVQPCIVTGDNLWTAQYIAEESGVFDPKKERMIVVEKDSDAQQTTSTNSLAVQLSSNSSPLSFREVLDSSTLIPKSQSEVWELMQEDETCLDSVSFGGVETAGGKLTKKEEPVQEIDDNLQRQMKRSTFAHMRSTYTSSVQLHRNSAVSIYAGCGEEQKKKVRFAVSQDAFSVLLSENCPTVLNSSTAATNKQFLLELFKRTHIFAHMTPQGKVDVIRFFIDELGVVVGMCGDGGNDCGALQAAHVGVALVEGGSDHAAKEKSTSEDTAGGGAASLISSFCALAEPSGIYSVVYIIEEGRACLHSSVACFALFVLYGLLCAFGKNLMLVEDTAHSEYVYLKMDIVVIIAVMLAMTRSRPTKNHKVEQDPNKLLLKGVGFKVFARTKLFPLLRLRTYVFAIYRWGIHCWSRIRRIEVVEIDPDDTEEEPEEYVRKVMGPLAMRTPTSNIAGVSVWWQILSLLVLHSLALVFVFYPWLPGEPWYRKPDLRSLRLAPNEFWNMSSGMLNNITFCWLLGSVLQASLVYSRGGRFRRHFWKNVPLLATVGCFFCCFLVPVLLFSSNTAVHCLFRVSCSNKASWETVGQLPRFMENFLAGGRSGREVYGSMFWFSESEIDSGDGSGAAAAPEAQEATESVTQEIALNTAHPRTWQLDLVDHSTTTAAQAPSQLYPFEHDANPILRIVGRKCSEMKTVLESIVGTSAVVLHEARNAPQCVMEIEIDTVQKKDGKSDSLPSTGLSQTPQQETEDATALPRPDVDKEVGTKVEKLCKDLCQQTWHHGPAKDPSRFYCWWVAMSFSSGKSSCYLVPRLDAFGEKALGPDHENYVRFGLMPSGLDESALSGYRNQVIREIESNDDKKTSSTRLFYLNRHNIPDAEKPLGDTDTQLYEEPERVPLIRSFPVKYLFFLLGLTLIDFVFLHIFHETAVGDDCYFWARKWQKN
ncbi:unnamed protein product [Amoebophrya sp. A120]|nr:unnamed protein product [Amoebophrya sp. A120]|eukprot:GSA120T00005664001.1